MAAVSSLCKHGHHERRSWEPIGKGCTGMARDIDLREGWGFARYTDHPCQCECHQQGDALWEDVAAVEAALEPKKVCWCGHNRVAHSLRQCRECDTAGDGHIHRFAVEPADA